MNRDTSAVRLDQPLLSIRQLEVTYNGALVALQGVSLDCPHGSLVAIIGTNGAGKTTLLRAVSGFLPSDHARITDGAVLFDGVDVAGLTPHRLVRKGIALVPERDLVFTELTVEENLSLGKRRSEGFAYTRDDVYDMFPSLGRRRAERGGYLSGGERKMLAISRALLLSPRLLLVDELSFGLAPAIVAELAETLREVRRRFDVTMIVVEQNASLALAMADYVLVLETGSIVYDGPPDQISAHEDVREFYLGMAKNDAVRSYAESKTYRRTRRWSA